MRNRQIALQGLGLALVAVIFLLFRGVMSHLQALIVPLVLWGVSREGDRGMRIAGYIAYLAMVGLFFPVQAAFGGIYLVVALYMRVTGKGPVHRLGHLLLWWCLLPVGTYLTDFLFGTRILAITIGGIGSVAGYLVFMGLLSLILSSVQIWVKGRLQSILT